MIKIQGVSVTTGICVGTAKLIKEKTLIIQDHKIDDKNIDTEIEHFHASISEVLKEIEDFSKHFDIPTESKDILETHKMILLDPEFHSIVENSIRVDKKNIEQAVYQHFTNTVDYFSNLKNSMYAERSLDYEDVYHRLILKLKQLDSTMLDDISAGDIVLANDMPPSLVSQLHLKGVLGIVLHSATKSSHSVIIARALGMPIVTGIKYSSVIQDGNVIVIDAKMGIVIVDPTPDIYKEYTQLQNKINIKKKELKSYIDIDTVSADDQRIMILSNIDLPLEIDHLLQINTDGIGLFRTESFYIDHQKLPSEDEQYEVYKAIAEKLGNKPFVIRTIDIGGDKVAGWYNIEKEINPYLGCRGIRFSLRYKNIFQTQLRAILRASVYGNIKIMFPMIATMEEFLEAKEIFAQCKDDLWKAGIPFVDEIPLGTMIETPAAAICSGALARVSDFFSIGTNDLLQYTLAVDRNNINIQKYYNPYNPAFLYLILKTIQSAYKHDIPLSICGEIATDKDFIPLLLNAGVKELSMGLDHTLDIKRYIKSVDTQKGKALVEKIYECGCLCDTTQLIQQLNDISIKK
jgi:phosphotransferase system enzyme I (PtsI)